MVSLANSDLLAMVPDQWIEFPLTENALVAIDISEPLPTRPIVIMSRAGFPLTPAADFLVNLVRRYQSNANARMSKLGSASSGTPRRP